MSHLHMSDGERTASPKKRQAGLSGVEIVALCIVVAAIAAFVANRRQVATIQKYAGFSGPAVEELELLQRYGPQRHSRNHEEWIIRDHFKDRRDGVFLDVGANHYQRESNTYFLETSLGWSGIAIDALEEFGPDYAAHRPRTKFVAMFASDVPDATVQFFVPTDNKLVASSSREFTQRFGAAGAAREVPTTTLNAVLDEAGIQRIDFLSMDIELAEPKALAGFDVGRFQPQLVCIEAHYDVRQQILDYFASHGYVVAGRYLRADPYNLYFVPVAR